jgi:predicted nucleic acid-binding protein
MVDAGIFVRWKIASEEHAAEARELLLDWRGGAISLSAPDHVFTEVMSAFLKASRRGRLSADEARAALEDLLNLPLTRYKATKRIILRAFEIASRENQRGYDCVYVALAERKGIPLWTGDERLYNALHVRYPFIRRIGYYLRTRASP